MAQPIGSAEVDTFYSTKISVDVYRRISKMPKLFGFDTEADFVRFLKTGETFYYLSALMRHMPDWPEYDTTGITITKVMGKVVACEKTSKMLDTLSATMALDSIPLTHVARGWKPLDWLAWAVYGLDVKLRLPGQRFGSAQKPHTVAQSRERIYRAILFCKGQRWTEAELKDGRMDAEDLETADPDMPSTAYDGHATAEDYEAGVALSALLATANKTDKYDLSTPYGQYLVLKSVEERIINPSARMVLSEDHTQDILNILRQNNGPGITESAEDRLAAMSGESLALLAHQQKWDKSNSNSTVPEMSQGAVDAAINYETLLVSGKIDQNIWGTTTYAHAVGRMGPLSEDMIWSLNDAQGHAVYRWKHAAGDEQVVPYSWQLEAIVAGLNRYTARDLASVSSHGMILADETGLGKTLTVICLMSAIATLQAAGKHPKKPHLILVPGELIDSTINDIRRIDSRFKKILYYKGKRKVPHHWPEAEVEYHVDTLERGDIEGLVDPHFTVVISTIGTWRTRHGPKAQRLWQTENGYDASDTSYDRRWPNGMAGAFGFQWTDEAHLCKNADAAGTQSLVFLRDTFFCLSTATPLSNSVADIAGYVAAMETESNKTQHERNLDRDPFRHDLDSHPERVVAYGVVRKFVLNGKLDTTPLAHRVKKIFARIMIRRTYFSEDNKYTDTSPVRRIGDHIPVLVTNRLAVEYVGEALTRYEVAQELARQNLLIPDSKDTGKMTINHAVYRELTLLSSALWFDDIHLSLMSGKLKYWKNPAEHPRPLYSIVKQIHNARQQKYTAPHPALFTRPAATDVTAQLAFLARESPKIRAVLSIILQYIVIGNKKVAFVCHGPAMQIVLYAIFKALQIQASTYTSELKSAQRAEEIRRFNESHGDSMAWIATYSFGSVGLNLQKHCSLCVTLDSPINMGQLKQFQGRLRRLGQNDVVRHIDIFTKATFQTWITDLFDKKLIPVMLCDLDCELQENEAINESGAEVVKGSFRIADSWFLHGGALKSGGTLTETEKAEGKALTPEQLVKELKQLRVEDIRHGYVRKI